MNGIKKILLGFAMASCAAFGGNAAAQGVDVYTWGGLCSDCSPTGDTPAAAALTLQNYTAGDQLSAANFVSFSYQSTVYNFSFFADATASIAGALPLSGNVDAPVTISGLTDSTSGLGLFSFSTVGDGAWTLALNGVSFDEHGHENGGKFGEHHESSHWSFDHHDDNYGGHGGDPNCSPIPEPETYAMMLAGLGLMGFIARRRKQNAAA